MNCTIAAIGDLAPFLYDHVLCGVVVLGDLVAGNERVDNNDVYLAVDYLRNDCVHDGAHDHNPAAFRGGDDKPLISPAILGGFLFAVAISFDNITATLFWKKPGIETVPTKIFAMLRTSISPEINALGTVMIILTILLPLIGGYVVRRFSRGR